VPINQHDLAIVLGLFGYVNLRSLCLMGVSLTREEIDSYIHMWRYAGFVLGVAEELLPESLEDQEEFFLASCVDEAHPDWVPPEVGIAMHQDIHEPICVTHPDSTDKHLKKRDPA